MLNNQLLSIAIMLSTSKGRINILRRSGVSIGDECEIYRGVNFGSEPYLIKLGNKVRITNGVKFVTHDGGLWTLRKINKLENADSFGTISIGDNTHIGFNAIIMPNVQIGRNCIIGCGAVVTKDIPDNSIAAGVPARVIETIEEYFDKKKNTCVFTKNLSAGEKKRYLTEIYFK